MRVAFCKLNVRCFVMSVCLRLVSYVCVFVCEWFVYVCAFRVRGVV